VLNLPVGPMPPVVINALGGDDRFVLNLKNGNPLTLVNLTLAGGAGNDAVAITDSAADAALSFTEASGAIAGSTFVHGSIERIELAMPQAASLSLGANVHASVTAPGRLFSTGGITMDSGAKLDLGNGDLVVRNGDLAAITALVRAARDGAVRWQGNGIGTTTATSVSGLAVMQQAQDVLVKHTYDGDANGDGRINADDYFRIDSAFLAQPQNPTYAQGDFNYDRTINADDYFLIDSAFLGQAAPMSAAAAAPQAAMASAGAVTSEPISASSTTKRSLTQRVIDTVTKMSRRRKVARAR
jgi:hypothetical protein